MKISRMSVILKYAVVGCGRIEFDARTNRRDDEHRDVRKCEADRVIIDSVTQLAIAAAIDGVPRDKIEQAITQAYADVAERRT